MGLSKNWIRVGQLLLFAIFLAVLTSPIRHTRVVTKTVTKKIEVAHPEPYPVLSPYAVPGPTVKVVPDVCANMVGLVKDLHDQTVTTTGLSDSVTAVMDQAQIDIAAKDNAAISRDKGRAFKLLSQLNIARNTELAMLNRFTDALNQCRQETKQ